MMTFPQFRTISLPLVCSLASLYLPACGGDGDGSDATSLDAESQGQDQPSTDSSEGPDNDDSNANDSPIDDTDGKGADNGETSPTPFSFDSVEDLDLGEVIESEEITLQGFNEPLEVSISGAEFRVDDSTYTAEPSIVSPNQKLQLKASAPDTLQTEHLVEITIGDFSTTWSLTTRTGDIEPEPFSFAPQTDLTPNSYALSEIMTIEGVEERVLVSIEAGQYSIDGGPFVHEIGSISSGQTIQVRVATATEVSTTTTVSLSVGSSTTKFSATTIDVHETNSSPSGTTIGAIQPFHGVLVDEDITDGMSLHSIRVADLNKDGHTDIVATFDTLGVVWFENDGATYPSFTKHDLIANANSYAEIALADLDEDGDVDIVVEEPSLGITWLKNDGTSSPTFEQVLLLEPTPETGSSNRRSRSELQVSDLNHDGHSDIAFVEGSSLSASTKTIAWLRNDGSENPAFVLEELYSSTLWIRSLTASDLNGDGHTDLVASQGSSGLVVFTSNGQEPPEWSHRVLDATGTGALAVGDWDGDGDQDLALADYDDDRLYFYENDGASTPSLSISSSTYAQQVSEISAVDMDKDGDIDFVTDTFLNIQPLNYVDRLEWYQNTGSFGLEGYVSRTRRLGYDSGWTNVTPVDLNADGVLELLTNRQNNPFDGSSFVPPLGWYDLSDVSYDVEAGSLHSEPLLDHIQDGDGNILSFSVLGGPDAGAFTIDAERGTLEFQAPSAESPEDFDGDNVYRVWVSADDGFLTTNFLFAITVIPVTN